jgi:hypothetical protein
VSAIRRASRSRDCAAGAPSRSYRCAAAAPPASPERSGPCRTRCRSTVVPSTRAPPQAEAADRRSAQAAAVGLDPEERTPPGCGRCYREPNVLRVVVPFSRRRPVASPCRGHAMADHGPEMYRTRRGGRGSSEPLGAGGDHDPQCLVTGADARLEVASSGRLVHCAAGRQRGGCSFPTEPVGPPRSRSRGDA